MKILQEYNDSYVLIYGTIKEYSELMLKTYSYDDYIRHSINEVNYTQEEIKNRKKIYDLYEYINYVNN